MSSLGSVTRAWICIGQVDDPVLTEWLIPGIAQEIGPLKA
jgi:hypothetical protein